MTPPIDIRADHLRIVRDVLRRHLPDGVSVWVFGSRATWMTKDSSDLDLALEGDTEIPPRSLSMLEAAFEDSDLPFAVDVVDVKRIGERFRRIVAEQRVRLPESDKCCGSGVDQAIDITAEERATVLELLDRHLPGTPAWVYGSRVKWTSRPQSDLGLVVFATPEQRRQVGDLREAFEESSLPFRVDLFVWDEVPVSLRKQIEAEHAALAGGIEEPSVCVWPTVELGEIAQVVGGGTPSTKDRGNFDGDVPWLTPKDLSAPHYRIVTRGCRNLSQAGLAASSARVVPTGAVLVSTRAPIGYVAIAGNPIATNQGFRSLILDSNAESDYIYYWLRQNTAELERCASGSTFKEISGSNLQRICIPLPPRGEQRAIAHILGTLDDKIELNRRMNATLEAMARALFRSWFVDFDPVRAKMEGRGTGLPKDIADLFPDRLVDSELGEIPEGWRASTLAEVALLNPESWSSRNAPEHILYVDLATTKWGYIDEIRRYSWAVAPSRGRRVLRRGDTIVGTVRPGNGSFAVIDRDGLTGSTGFAVLRPNDSVGREIVWCAATSHDTIDRLAHLADGGAYPAVNPKAVLDTALVLPDARVRGAFSSLTAPLLDRLQENQREARTLGTVRDVLLPKLVSGELRVNVREQAQPADERSIATAEASA